MMSFEVPLEDGLFSLSNHEAFSCDVSMQIYAESLCLLQVDYLMQMEETSCMRQPRNILAASSIV